MLSLNQSPGEFESKDEGSGATGKPGRLPEGGSLDLGFEGGRGGTPRFLATPLLGLGAATNHVWELPLSTYSVLTVTL